ncbi:MAG: pyridoxamine 5'-phosphate oxidase family protein [Nocardioidaceae bacterium]
MFETRAELRRLQGILDAALAGATDHLRGIIDDRRTLRATEITGLMSGMRTLSLATVTARGEPRVSAVDGHFLHACWVFSTSVTSAKARQLLARPAVSASYVEGEELGVFTHGSAYRITEDDATYDATLAHLTDHYGSSPLSWGDTALFRLEPSWMVGYAAHRESLLASRGVGRDE